LTRIKKSAFLTRTVTTREDRAIDRQPALLLQKASCFGGLSRERCRELAAVCRRRELGKGDYLFLEGERGNSFFLLASGGIQLSKASEAGQEVVIKTVEPGEVFAEVVLFEQDRYPVSALALGASVVWAIPREGFLHLLDQNSFREEFIGGLMARMRYLADRILSLTVYDVEARFFRFLEEQYGRRESYRLAMSKKALAAAIGTTPETLSRLAQRLKREGRIRWEGRALEVDTGAWP
jgi:CRP/FNR family transcriptional regulator